MDIIKTGIGITKTIKNVTRFREILNIFGRHGFDELIMRTGILKFIPGFVINRSKKRIDATLKENPSSEWQGIIGYRLKKCFEELGPGFVKLGQFLASREDLFDQSFIEQMRSLQDNVKGIPFEEAEKIIEKSLGKPIKEVFDVIDPKAIGQASVGVVYKGVLRNGDEVVIKVRRPNIKNLIVSDFEIVLFLVERLEAVSDEIKYLGISRLLQDFYVTIQNELDFNLEALNNSKFKALLDKYDDHEVVIPKIYQDYVTKEVLVMERFKGIPFSKTSEIIKELDIVEEKLLKGLKLFIKFIVVEGFFHADLHGGNFFLLENKKIGLIDFGLTGVLTKRSRENLVAILYALVSNNYENLIYEFLDVADYDELPNVDELIKDIHDALVPFVGLTANNLDSAEIFNAIVKTLSKHRIYLPREWFVIFRGLISLDGVGKSLGIDIDIFGILEKDLVGIFSKFFDKGTLFEEAIWLSRDGLNSMRILPRQFKWFIKDFTKNKYVFRVRNSGYEKELQYLGQSVVFLGFSGVSAVLALIGTLFIEDKNIANFKSIPIITYIFWVISLMLFLKALVLSRR